MIDRLDEDELSKEEEISLFKRVVRNIENNRVNKENGIYNSIPFNLPKLDENVPGVMKGVHYCITAATGAAKTQLTKYLFVLQPYKFIKRHPELKIRLKIIYFALEETKEDFFLNLIANRLFEQYNIRTSLLELKSMGSNTLSKDILDKVKESAEYFEDLEDYLEIVDEIYNPTGLYKHCRKYATEHGMHYYRRMDNKNPKPEELITVQQYNGLKEGEKEKYCYACYKPDDENEFVIIVNDHISLLDIENTPDANTKHLTISKWSTDYVRKMLTKRFNYCVVDVHQQEMALGFKIFFVSL